MFLPAGSSSEMLILLCIGLLSYFIYIAIQRVYFSPLSHIPGPKIAAATTWYEIYHDVIRRGLYFKKVKEFHKIYGTYTSLPMPVRN